MSLVKRNTGGLSSVFSDFFDSDKLFDQSLFKKSELIPAVNVKENGDTFEVEVAAPGLKKEDFNVSVENGILNISAEKREEKEDKEENFTRKEFSYSSFSRSFTLPENVNEEQISAKYEDGLLRLNLAKTTPQESPAKKQVDIG